MIVRVREGLNAVAFNHQTEAWVTLKAGAKYAADDPFVIANPWAFESDLDAPVESASAAPGTKRPYTRRTPAS